MRRGFGWLSTITLTALLLLTGIGAWAAHSAVHSEENRLLSERTNEVSLVLRSAVDTLSRQLDVLGGVLRATDSSPGAFRRAATATLKASGGDEAFAVARKSATGYVIEMAKGAGLHRGQPITDGRTAVFDRAMKTGKLVPTELVTVAGHRILGFAEGPPTAPGGTVIYEQLRLGPLGPPREAGTAPFSELEIVLYGSSQPKTSQALVSTTRSLPLQGEVRTRHLSVGAVDWTLQVTATSPLVGEPTAAAPWYVVAAGLVLAGLVAILIEIERRRRTTVLARYDEERRLAEDLQRSLLPQLPEIPALDVAARYLPGTTGQQVGGDWYDVFDAGGGRVGIVIGDVGGHDLSAAGAMSRVQAALRACATLETEPAAVLDRLDQVVAALPNERLVTVFYGVLDPPGRGGARRLRYANAGHPPPLVHRPDGGVTELAAATSPLLGVPVPLADRLSSDVMLPAGAVLLLFTDGLVETPEESLSVSLERLRSTAADSGHDIDPEQLCDRLLDNMRTSKLRDDVAVLAVQLAIPERTARR